MHATPQTLVGKRVPVLDKGEILCTGILGDDHTIVESARVSFLGESKGDVQDKRLLKYLLYHQHTSPFEMVEFAFRVKAPIFVFRQWMRHRMCLAGDTELYFDEPAAIAAGTHKVHKITLERFHDLWKNGFAETQLHLRMLNEDSGEIEHTQVENVWQSGTKPVFRVTLENGYTLKMSKDHRVLTESGWRTLTEATHVHLRDNNHVTWDSHAPAFAVNGERAYRDAEWLGTQRNLGLSVAQRVYKLIRTFSHVKEIVYCGEELTYDVDVTGPYHNFIANGFVVHNSEYNEWSARYSEMKEEFYIPTEWRVQDKRNKQASQSGELPHAELSAQLETQCNAAYQLYEQMLVQGVAREMARLVLPVNMYSVMMVKMNAHALMHFIELRAAPDAQFEIREYARLLFDEFFKPALPWTAEFFDVASTKRHEVAELLRQA